MNSHFLKKPNKATPYLANQKPNPPSVGGNRAVGIQADEFGSPIFGGSPIGNWIASLKTDTTLLVEQLLARSQQVDIMVCLFHCLGDKSAAFLV